MKEYYFKLIPQFQILNLIVKNFNQIESLFFSHSFYFSLFKLIESTNKLILFSRFSYLDNNIYSKYFIWIKKKEFLFASYSFFFDESLL